jgi:hypothetical protein
MSEAVNHPAHYGGEDNPYEAIKVIEAWKLGFNLGNTVKYISREAHKGAPIQDLKKALWYLQRELDNRIAASAAKPTARKGTRTRIKTRYGSKVRTVNRTSNAKRAGKRGATSSR